MDFDSIYLSKKEMKALRYLNKRGVANCEEFNPAVLARLESLEFVYFVARSDMKRIDNVRGIPKDAVITERGRLYVRYTDGKKRENKRSSSFNLMLVIVGAVLSLLLERLPVIVMFFKEFFNIR